MNKKNKKKTRNWDAPTAVGNILIGYSTRFRIRQKLLQYICKVNPFLSEIPEVSVNIKSLDLIKICNKIRNNLRKKSHTNINLNNIHTIESIYYNFENNFNHSSLEDGITYGWSKLQKSYFISNFVVKSWIHNKANVLNKDISLIVPSEDHNFAYSWKNGDDIILGYKGVRLLWGNLVVNGYFKDTDLTFLNSIFNKVQVRFESISKMLKSNNNYNKLNVDGYLKDLGPREILVANNHQIIWDYERLEKNWKRVVNMPLTPLAKEVDKLNPYLFIQLIHSLMVGNHSNVSKEQTQCRLLYELICIKHNDVDDIIANSFPYRIRRKVCKRMIGLTTISTKTHRKYMNNNDLPLEKKVNIKFEDHPKILHAIRDRLREWTESRPGSDTHGKATQFLESLLLLPIGVFKRHPVINLRLNCFGNVSTVNIDSVIKDRENELVALINKPKIPPVPSMTWCNHWDAVRDFRFLRQAQIHRLKETDAIMDETVYGCKPAKRIIRQLVAQWLGSRDSPGCVIGLEGPPGVGKCFRQNTPIMMANGTIKMVQDIKVGEQIMGDDSTPRNILSLGRGQDNMYEIIPQKGESYTVNSEHILCLKPSGLSRIEKLSNDRYKVCYFNSDTIRMSYKTFYNKLDAEQYLNKKIKTQNSDIVEIEVKDYLKLPNYIKDNYLKGYKVPIVFAEKEVDIEPYYLGMWLGDGHSNGTGVTTIEKEVVEYLTNYASRLELKLRSKKTEHNADISYYITSGRGGKKGRNKLLNMLRNNNLIMNKHIPHIYKCNSRKIQLEVLAGIIDSDGGFSLASNSYDVIQKNEKLLDDIIFIARSLGLAAYKKKCEKSCMYKGERKWGTYYRTNIHGPGLNEIPVKCPRKKAGPRKQKKDVLNNGITVKHAGYDNYYGFEIDGNRRFILGDFTVTHNTTIVREGLARCFGTREQPHPFEFISLGGANSNSTLVGWTYTWHTSSYGRIAGALMKHKCMNPILYFDELDKVSKTNEGKEIISILTHLTDPVQNAIFKDRYFADIPLDLSKCLVVFSYNDPYAIDPILLDRVQRIKIDPMTVQAKIQVAELFLLPTICKEVGVLPYTISDDLIKFIIERYTNEAGVRKLKELLLTIIRERNRLYLCGYSLTPIECEFDIERLLVDSRPSRIERVSCDETHVGAINALFATTSGSGGIIPVQVVRKISNKSKEGSSQSVLITGRQGETMKESVNIALTVAMILAGKTENHNNFHLHCSDGGTKKDGPSAGCAFALAFLSVLKNMPCRQNIALTGEVDLRGQVCPIGGLPAKISGAISHGVDTILIPEKNRDDCERYLKENNLPEHVKILYINTVLDAAKLVLVGFN